MLLVSNLAKGYSGFLFQCYSRPMMSKKRNGREPAPEPRWYEVEIGPHDGESQARSRRTEPAPTSLGPDGIPVGSVRRSPLARPSERRPRSPGTT
jgi:hypothetical protein